jgi:hypothetical protein
MRCEWGYCLVCDKVLAEDCAGCGRKKTNQFYTEVQLPWSNGSRMNVAVCTDCAQEKVFKADKTEMTKAIWDAWDRQGGHYSKEIILV